MNSKYDPERLRRRRIVLICVVGVVLAILVAVVMNRLLTYQRTSDSKQQSLMNSDEPVVVLFYSKTCSDCKKITMTVHKNALTGKVNDDVKNLANSASPLKHNVMFLEYQNPQDRSLFIKYGVSEVPTFMVMKHGIPQSIGTVSGVSSDRYSGTDRNQIKSIYQNLQVTGNAVNK